MPLTPVPVRIRIRDEDDLPALEAVLAAQQPASHYPFRWPLPFPTRDFIVRPHERAAWVAVADDRVTGHVSVTAVEADDLGVAWAAGTGCPPGELDCLSVLFVDYRMRGAGIGSALLDTAEQWIFTRGRTAVLDVVQKHSAALEVYRHRGWREIGQARPDWLPRSGTAGHPDGQGCRLTQTVGDTDGQRRMVAARVSERRRARCFRRRH